MTDPVRGPTGPRREHPAVLTAMATVLLVVYVVILAWLTLFKLSFDIPMILAEHQTRVLNLVPFAGGASTGRSETVSNLVVFVPLGVLLGVTFPRARLWRLLGVAVVFSVVVEALQWVLAIGVTDVTDVVMNAAGGLLGLALQRLARKAVGPTVVTWVVVAAGAVLCVAFLVLRVFVLRVRY
jgi:glycopeptide antibiotics resistance protein